MRDRAPLAGVGAHAVVMPDGETILVSIVQEGFLLGPDWAPGSVGVIRDAGSPAAYLDQVVPVVSQPSGWMPYLLGGLVDGDGTVSVPLVQVAGDPDGLQRLRWDPTAAPNVVSDEPIVWMPEWLNLDYGTKFLVDPVGPGVQAIAVPQVIPDYDLGVLLVWGRQFDELGIRESGVQLDGCTWWAKPYTGPPETIDTGAVDSSTSDSGEGSPGTTDGGQTVRAGCGGCAHDPRLPRVPALVLGLIAVWIGRHRARHEQDLHQRG
jgi:hypothetical protein